MISAVVLLLVLVVLSSIVCRRTQPPILKQGRVLKSPPDTLPLLGNAIKFLQPRHLLFDWFVQCERQFGDETLEISVPFLPPGVIISDPANLDFVLKNEATITKGDFFKKRSWDLFGYGIINASGELWKAQRKAGLKFFTGANLDVMVDEVLPEMYAKTRKTLLEGAKEGQIVDMAKVFLDLTTAVVGQMAYDMEIDASSPFSKAFDYASNQIGLRFQNPLYQITELFTGSEFQHALTEVKKFGRKIVANAKTRRSHIAFDSLITNEEPVFGTLIDSLIETFQQPEVIADAALNFLSAGRDTTAQSLTWTLHRILRHPPTLDLIRNEINTLLPTTITKSTRQYPSTPSLQPAHTPHLTSSLYESLRLHPPVPFELKQCETPTTLPDDTSLPRHSIVIWCIHAMNRSPIRFGPDPDTFRPERWLVIDDDDETAKFLPRPAHEFPVFNGGPRACLGKKMAELMAVWVLAVLLGEFDFAEVYEGDGDGDGEEGEERKERERKRITCRSGLTLPMEGGFPCRVKVRGVPAAAPAPATP